MERTICAGINGMRKSKHAV